MEVVYTVIELFAGLALFYIGFAAIAWCVLAMANVWFYVRDFKSKTKHKNKEAMTSAELRAYELLTDNPKVLEVYNKLQKHPYIQEPHPAAKSNNAYRALLQQKLRRIVPEKVVRVAIYDLANKKE